MKSYSLYIIGVVVAIIALQSCKAQRQAIALPTTETRIETHITREYVTDTIYVSLPQQSAERISLDTISVLEIDVAKSLARINQDGTLYHNLETKQVSMAAEIKTEIVYRDSIAYREEIIPQPYPVVTNKLSAWQRIQVGGFWSMITLSLVFAIFRIRKI